ncbi:hypothetical protein AGDE_16097 [Angomonas deanei]|uniref:Uncharacterized protein n=1 Tax=Angomonas deanei TaxID=59799 RepID=A0A7G2CJF7_9TRYP|nr:hypothetical protein AGDE_16097 [Angomonas deanei]CAD2219187.1 hypothetical protein, conserved [Angomonas deanei]|eukprot:EPY17715.1 hypothetical protein AGDE_16097 [Angomonas deanei]
MPAGLQRRRRRGLRHPYRLHPATAEESKREGSPYKNASKERSVSQGNVSCATNVLRENEFNFFGFRESDENGNVVIKADECAPWKEHFLNGYASFLQRNDLLPKDSQASNEIYVVLPCEHWFSANTSYEQFIHLLVSCYFARGADLLNYTARVHKLVQYFELHLNWAAGTDCPSRPVEIINLDLLTNDGQSDMDYSNRELSESEDEMEEAVEDDGELDREADEEEPKEEEPQEEEEPEPPVEEQEEEKDEEEFDPEANIVVHFRESAPAPSGRPSGEEAPVEEEKPFVRRHKCYLAGEYPEKEGEGQRAHHATSVERDDDEEAAAEEPAAEEEQEEENESVESVPISHADENFKPPEGTVRKVREL